MVDRSGEGMASRIRVLVGKVAVRMDRESSSAEGPAVPEGGAAGFALRTAVEADRILETRVGLEVGIPTAVAEVLHIEVDAAADSQAVEDERDIVAYIVTQTWTTQAGFRSRGGP